MDPAVNAAPSPDQPVQSKIHAEFKVKSMLGRGGFGIVFEVEHPLDKHGYAVKRIPIEEREGEAAHREVQTMAQFDHPAIVRYHNSWIEKPPNGWQWSAQENSMDGLRFVKEEMPQMRKPATYLYIQMELCQSSLAQWLSENFSTRSMSNIKTWFHQIVSAVDYMHGQDIIHRDLKPSNILFAGEDRLKICDMGIATYVKKLNGDEVLVSRTSDVGTVLYQAPEQSEFSYTSKVDIFTLGLILAEMCVVMTASERSKIFDNYRRGTPNNIERDNAQLADLITMLTKKKDTDRPECKSVLDHPFLTGQTTNSTILQSRRASIPDSLSSANSYDFAFPNEYAPYEYATSTALDLPKSTVIDVEGPSAAQRALVSGSIGLGCCFLRSLIVIIIAAILGMSVYFVVR